MKSTQEFLADLHDRQAKDERNRKKGKGHPMDRLPNKQHSQAKGN
ncbi:DUF4023 domain-containing protein [Bacillus sp. Marseille-P3661]|nr:DUF4023 domain-containing protein [Bacillus sp. Marseille-P3661]